MIAAVLDTNTVVSGLGWRGSVPARVMDAAAAGRIVAVTSPPLLAELARVLRYEKLAPIFPDPAAVVAHVEEISVVVEPRARVTALADESDNRLLEAAIAASADYVVTGDAGPLALRTFEGTQIVSPRELLDLIGDKSDPGPTG